MCRFLPLLALVAPAVLLPAAPAPKVAPSWPMLGGSPARNMASTTARGLPDDWDLESGRNVRWVAQLGSRSYTQPVVAGGHILIGTNNENPRNKRDRGRPTADDPLGPPVDKGVLMCFRASDGKFLWQAVHNMLERGHVSDWPREGVCSSPAVEADRAYYVSNRAEVICVDLNGFGNGNDGDQDEPNQDPTDADFVWSFDMTHELKVFPHNKANSSPVIAGDLLFVVTSNGVDEAHVNVPAPSAPSFICLNNKTGKLVWKSGLPGANIMHGQWSSPAYGVIGGHPQVVFAGGDGWLYGLEPETGKLIWQFDANPKGARYELGGRGTRSDFIACPVIHDGKVYIGTGQDPEHLEGVGHFWCIAPAGKTGDISPELATDGGTDPPKPKPNPNSGAVWHYGGEDKRPFAHRDYVFGRTLSTACVVDGVVYIAELAGYVHCLDAQTGRLYWVYDTKSNIWGSCYYADGKVYVGNEDGDVFVFRHDRKPRVLESPADAAVQAAAEILQNTPPGENPKARNQAARRSGSAAAARARQRVGEQVLIRRIEMEIPIRSTPSAVADTLYIATESKLFAIGKKE